MTTTGSGVGGTVGGPQIPLQEDLAKTAWTDVNKAALGIVYDSIEMAFTQMNPRYTTGYLGGFGYRASSENPILDHPLESLRADVAFDEPGDTSWEQTYDDMVDSLPDDLKQIYQNEAALPLTQRSSSFLAIDSAMRGAAQLITQLNTIPETFSADSLQAARVALNQLLPFAALKGSLVNTGEIMLAVQTFLIQQGSNYTNFDGYINTMRQIDAALLLLEFVNGSLSNTTDGQLTNEAAAAAERAAVLLSGLSEQLSAIPLGSDLQILSTAVNTLLIVALSMSLPDTNSSPLFFSLSAALMGAYTSDSALGEIGPGVASLIAALSGGALSSDGINASVGGAAFLEALIATIFLYAIGLSSLAVDNGIGQYAFGANEDTDSIRLLAYRAAVQMLLASGVATSFFEETAALSGADEESQQQIAAALVLYTLILADNAVATGTGVPIDSLTEWQRTVIDHGITAALALSEGNDETSNAVRTALQTASIALSENDSNSFNSAMNDVFEALGITSEQLQNDLTTITNAADTTANALRSPNLDTQITGIVNVVS